MNVLALTNFATSFRCFIPGEVAILPDDDAAPLIRCGYVAKTDKNPPEIASFLAKLTENDGEKALFLPFLGEFGHLIMTHIRVVHWSKTARKVVCCQPGEEVLYPSAAEFCTDWHHPVPDAYRVGTLRDRMTCFDFSELIEQFPGHVPVVAGGLTMTQELYAINPGQHIPFRPRPRGLRASVCLGVRVREFCPERNWQHWPALAGALTATGIDFATIGARPTTLDLPEQKFHTGDYDTDATIEALQNCQLYVGTDTGISHLAATVGCPMLIFRETRGGSRDCVGRMEEVNPGNVTRLGPGAWNNPQIILQTAIQILVDRQNHA